MFSIYVFLMYVGFKRNKKHSTHFKTVFFVFFEGNNLVKVSKWNYLESRTILATYTDLNLNARCNTKGYYDD